MTEAEKEWLRDHPKVRVAGPQHFPPFYFYEKTMEPQGISADTMRAVAKEIGLEIEIIPDLPWSQVLEMAKDRKVDWIPCAAIADQRRQYLDFSEPYLSFPLVILTASDSGFIGGITDLNGKKVSGVKNIMWLDWLEADGISFDWAPVESPLEALRAVSEGKADVTIENLGAASFNIDKFGLTNLKVAAPTAYKNYTLHFAVRDDWPELHSILNKTLMAMGPQQKSAIKSRWLSLRYEHGLRFSDIIVWAGGIGLVVILILGLIIAWNRRLGREIALRKEIEQDLYTSLSLLNETLEQAPMGIQILERDEGQIRLIIENQESKKIKDQLCGAQTREDFALEECQELRFLDIDSNEPVPWNRLPVSRAFSGETVENERLIAEGRGGTQVPLETSASPVFGTNGEVDAVFSAFSDISLRLLMEEDQLQSQKMEAIGTLTGGIAHDFNNILSIIIGNAELASNEVPTWGSTFAKLSEIQSAGMRARDLVRHLLNFSRKAPMVKKPVVLSTIVQESISLLQATIAADIEIRCQGMENPGIILADATQIHQVLINLCTNAAHAMEEGGGILYISLDSIDPEGWEASKFPNLDPGSYMQLEVRDTGTGMSKTIADRIFDPYFTTKEQGKGTGLGLSVVHGIVRSCAGAVFVESALDRGTRITVLFPASDALIPLPAKVPAPPKGGSERVLLVDDERQIVEMVHQMLERFGYKVAAFTDSIKALEAFQKAPEQFDIIITDMTMPFLAGDTLAKKVRIIRDDIPILLCTGFSEKIKKLRSVDLGIITYLRKPVPMDQLATEVRKALDRNAT
ncbi:MAG: transporter substrate-binding domain-containing protein [Desulfatibacillum sp.]|nr:transporter substrate-binding domain-containing protein [Desulfatibacillum sp.]